MSKFLADDISPRFSIVINTLNRAELLGDAIRGVLQLDYPHIELVVVNGPSTDRSEEVLQAWQGKIKHVRCAEPNLSMSRNVGIETASGDIVAFLDDDAVPHPFWLRYLARQYVNPVVGGVGGFTVDNTGVRWQVRKTVCDRFGNAFFPEDSFDERTLNFPGTPYYPSLLGTNSSFRRKALIEIGGFDHTFAYLLDETDVCLRLVDAGWHVVYEPAAMMFHQFAESHIRTTSRKPKTLFPSVVSKSYFINRHGQAEGFAKAGEQLDAYRAQISRDTAWLADHGDISPLHRVHLDDDLAAGIETGLNRSFRAMADGKVTGDLDMNASSEPFLPVPQHNQLRIALVSQGLPPVNDAGIARWTWLLAQGLRDLGVVVHIIQRATDGSARRYCDGIWFHEIAQVDEDAGHIAATYHVPVSGVADWMAGVMHEIDFIKTFGLDLVSFPIWDLEALPVLDDPELATVLSLHTTYKLARPFKREWNSRIIYARQFVDRMVAAERQALQRAPNILANSQAVITEIEKAYDLEITDRCTVVPHGTTDILATQNLTPAQKASRRGAQKTLRVLFAGRFEDRKGYDLAFKVAAKLTENRNISFSFVGSVMSQSLAEDVKRLHGVDPLQLPNATFHGEVSREALDGLFVDADIVLMPSRFESFGLVAIEAMSAAAPVIALGIGGLGEVVTDGVSGFLYADEMQFVSGAVRRLTELSDNSSQLLRLQDTTYAQFQQQFSVVAMANQVKNLYEAAVNAKKGLKHD